MPEVYLYTTRFCPYCIQAKHLLTQKGVSFRELAIDQTPSLRGEMISRSGRRTVPQIWVGDTHVGGCDDLFALERSGRLDQMLG